LFLDLSGGCWFWRDEYAAIPHSAFIDSDPAFTQIAVSKATGWYPEFFRRFGCLFTFGSNIGTPACAVPTGGLQWEHTWQPICIDQWQPIEQTKQSFTTVMSWKIESFADIGGNKDQELAKFFSLPANSSAPLELALAGDAPRPMLLANGWKCREAFEVSRTPELYRDYIRSSLGEFSVAKHTYVHTRSGWFSDRTECYLACGRPAVVQDTGFSAHLPTGSGLMAYTTLQEACGHLESVMCDYGSQRVAAREIARAHFAADVILPPLLERATQQRPQDLRTKATAS
jgi:hypothetical protein